jgi:hypothetical protein
VHLLFTEINRHFLFLLLFIFLSFISHFRIYSMESNPHAMMTSTKSTIPPPAWSSIEYKRPTINLLLAILTLYPSPSPVFYATCLPALIYLHRCDLRLFILHTAICVGLVSLTAELRGGREIISAGVRSFMGIGTIVGSVIAHHALLALSGRVAWIDSLLFGLLWSGCGIVSRVIHFVS